jgi:NAD(P)-dependent dehydrogenase (short-subunit alcohol dehydrogenase family)
MAVHGRTVIVTGGVSGIGAAVVEALTQSGFLPVAVDIKPRADVELPTPALCWDQPLDVSDEAQVSAGVAAIEAHHGPVEGLVNAAGILGKMHTPDRLRMTDWDREIAVDLRGTFLMCRAVGAAMAQRGHGSIVNIASVVGSSSAPVHGYGPAKAAVINLTLTLAAEWGPRGVRVNAISPGFTRTPALEKAFEAGALSKDDMTRNTALGRLVEPIEVGRAAAWLIGPQSSGITGVNLVVDAGFLAGVSWTAYGGLRGA